MKDNELPRAVELAGRHARGYCSALSCWVRSCYEEDTTKEYAVAGVLRFSEFYWWCRSGLRGVWKLVEEWEMREPGEHRNPAPPIAVKAAIAVAAAWGWHRVAALMRVMFHGVLRPGEAGELKVGDFKFIPGEAPEEAGNYVVVIREPKAARKHAKTQHMILDKPLLVSYLKWYSRGGAGDGYFYGMGNATFADGIARLLKRLQPEELFTPSGLRTGGAAHEWVRRRNFDQLRLRGSWMTPKTLEPYIQESVTQVALGNFGAERKRVARTVRRGWVYLNKQLNPEMKQREPMLMFQKNHNFGGEGEG